MSSMGMFITHVSGAWLGRVWDGEGEHSPGVRAVIAACPALTVEMHKERERERVREQRFQIEMDLQRGLGQL